MLTFYAILPQQWVTDFGPCWLKGRDAPGGPHSRQRHQRDCLTVGLTWQTHRSAQVGVRGHSGDQT